MWKITYLDTSVNSWKTLWNSEVSMVLGWASFFQNQQNTVKSRVDTVYSCDYESDRMKTLAPIWSDLYNAAWKIKDEFEYKNHQKIPESKFQNEVRDIHHMYFMEFCNDYDLYWEWYSKALRKKKTPYFESRIQEILEEKFSSIKYSMLRSAENTIRHVLSQYKKILP